MMERGQTLKVRIGVGGRVTPALPSRMRRPGEEVEDVAGSPGKAFGVSLGSWGSSWQYHRLNQMDGLAFPQHQLTPASLITWGCKAGL